MATHLPKVLVVEDDKDVVWTFQFAAQNRIQLLSAGDVKQSLQTLSEHPDTQILVTDFYLNDADRQDGLDVVQAFRKNCPNGYVFLITGEIKPNPRVDQLMKLPNVIPFHKPFSMKKLMDQILKALALTPR